MALPLKTNEVSSDEEALLVEAVTTSPGTWRRRIGLSGLALAFFAGTVMVLPAREPSTQMPQSPNRLVELIKLNALDYHDVRLSDSDVMATLARARAKPGLAGRWARRLSETRPENPVQVLESTGISTECSGGLVKATEDMMIKFGEFLAKLTVHCIGASISGKAGCEDEDEDSRFKDFFANTMKAHNAWKQTTTSNSVARIDHVGVYTGSNLCIHGGHNGTTIYQDLQCISIAASGNSWSEITVTGKQPSARAGHVGVWTGSQVVIHGGRNTPSQTDQTSYYGDVWVITPQADTSWAALLPIGSAPSGRDGHAAVYTGSQMCIQGGSDDGGLKQDLWCIVPSAGNDWAQLFPTGSLPGLRHQHVAVYDGAKMCIHGGQGKDGVLGDLWCIVPMANNTWTEIPVSGAVPPARKIHAGFYIGGRLCIHAGYGGTYLHDLWCITPKAGQSWTEITIDGTDAGERGQAASIVDGSRMCEQGGGVAAVDGEVVALSDVWCINPQACKVGSEGCHVTFADSEDRPSEFLCVPEECNNDATGAAKYFIDEEHNLEEKASGDGEEIVQEVTPEFEVTCDIVRSDLS